MPQENPYDLVRLKRIREMDVKSKEVCPGKNMSVFAQIEVFSQIAVHIRV